MIVEKPFANIEQCRPGSPDQVTFDVFAVTTRWPTCSSANNHQRGRKNSEDSKPFKAWRIEGWQGANQCA